MNIALWIAQGILAFMFGMHSFLCFQPEKVQEMFPWAKDRSAGLLRFVATAELLGVAGIILPMATGILPWLTPLAALGLATIQLLASFTVHVPRKEYTLAAGNVVGGYFADNEDY